MTQSNEILGPSFDPQEKIAETLNKIQDMAGAQQVLDAFTSAGIPKETILLNLFRYCGPRPTRKGKGGKVIDLGLETAQKINKTVGAVARELSRVADETEQILAALATLSPYTIHSGVPFEMRRLAERLEDIRELQMRGRPGVSGPNLYLFSLAKLLEFATGEPQYKGLSVLINAVQDDPQHTCSPESVEKVIWRFIKANRLQAAELSALAEEEVRQSRLTNQANPPTPTHSEGR